MRTLLVGYDLKSPGQNYAALIAALKSYGTWWHHLDSTWLIRTTESTSAVRNALVVHLDPNDELLVVDVTGGPAAWKGFNDRGSDWIQQNL